MCPVQPPARLTFESLKSPTDHACLQDLGQEERNGVAAGKLVPVVAAWSNGLLGPLPCIQPSALESCYLS